MICGQIPSPHGGTAANVPNKIIVHAMGEFIEGGDTDWSAWAFLDRLGFSAHAIITPSGVVIRSREDRQRAYHAKGHNRHSLGVEFLVPGVHTYATFLEAIKKDYLSPTQYANGLELVKNWIATFSVHSNRVVRHSDASPGRKHDPGEGFPWDQFVKDLFA